MKDIGASRGYKEQINGNEPSFFRIPGGDLSAWFIGPYAVAADLVSSCNGLQKHQDNVLQKCSKYILCKMLTGRGCFFNWYKNNYENEEIYHTSVSGKVGMDS